MKRNHFRIVIAWLIVPVFLGLSKATGAMDGFVSSVAWVVFVATLMNSGTFCIAIALVCGGAVLYSNGDWGRLREKLWGKPLEISYNETENRQYIPGGSIYRLKITNLSAKRVEGIRVHLVQIEPRFGDTAAIKRRIVKTSRVPLMRTHDREDNFSREYSLNADGDSFEVDVISLPDGRTPIYCIQHAIGKFVDGDFTRNVDSSIPRGDYTLVVRVSEASGWASCISIQIKDGESPAFIPEIPELPAANPAAI